MNGAVDAPSHFHFSVTTLTVGADLAGQEVHKLTDGEGAIHDGAMLRITEFFNTTHFTARVCVRSA